MKPYYYASEVAALIGRHSQKATTAKIIESVRERFERLKTYSIQEVEESLEELPESPDGTIFAKYNCKDYTLSGLMRVHGEYSKSEVVSILKRKNKNLKPPPIFDVIQLRCYMFLRGNIKGVLIEYFPDKTQITEYEWDDSEWEKIHDGLCKVSRQFTTIAEDHVILTSS